MRWRHAAWLVQGAPGVVPELGGTCACVQPQVYVSGCAARAAGVDVSVNGGCGEVVPGRVECGFRYCDARTSYCCSVVKTGERQGLRLTCVGGTDAR